MVDSDLSAPFLASKGLSQPSNGEPQVILTVHDEQFPSQEPQSQQQQQIPNGFGNHLDVLENPFEFLGLSRFELPGSTTVDPFRNNTLNIEGLYEWMKIGICLPIMLVRLVLFGLCMLVGFVATKIALQGWKDKENPMPKWRCRVMWVTRLATRGILFSFG